MADTDDDDDDDDADIGVFPDTLGKISGVSSIASPVLDLDDAFGVVDSTARSVSHSQKQCEGHHRLTSIFVCDIRIFENLSLKWLWEDDKEGCTMALPTSLQNVLTYGPRARQHTPT